MKICFISLQLIKTFINRLWLIKTQRGGLCFTKKLKNWGDKSEEWKGVKEQTEILLDLCMWFCWRTGPASQAGMVRLESSQECTGGQRGQWCCCYWDAKSDSDTSSLSLCLKAAGHFWVVPTVHLNHKKAVNLQWILKVAFVNICIYICVAKRHQSVIFKMMHCSQYVFIRLNGLLLNIAMRSTGIQGVCFLSNTLTLLNISMCLTHMIFCNWQTFQRTNF